MSVRWKNRLWSLKNKVLIFIEYLYWYKRIHRDPSSRVALGAKITGGENIHLGVKVRIFSNAILNCSESPFYFSDYPFFENKGSIIIGDRSSIRTFACLYTYGGIITIGKQCTINPFIVIYGHGGVTIGNDVHFGTHTVIVSSDHGFMDPDKPISEQPETRKGVVIEDGVWTGAGVFILDGVIVGKGSVIAAGAVVTNNIPPFSIAAGVPARVIKSRSVA
jgi:acetyltransferase-like isoleucine patch superfamily enzyme